MQPIVLGVSLVLMGAAAVLFWRAVRAVDGPPAGDGANRRRTQLIWTMTLVGVLVSVASLREWPHAIASEGEGVIVNVSGGQWYWDIDVEQVPLGTPVTFLVSSEDVNHGMGIYDENMRLLFQTQSMPGYVNKVSYTFEEPGYYQVLCMEFCGVAHHDMISEFEVVEQVPATE
ncbi:MAG: cytochrome C oxidase subunit I [Pseudomonadota bacterium]